MAIGVIVVWWSISDRAQNHMQQMADNAARLNQLLIRQDIGNRIAALDRLGQRWTAANGTPRLVWEADATRYVADMPGFRAIEWVDSTLHVRWVVPEAGNEAVLDLDVAQIDETRLALTAARENRQAVLSDPFELAQGGLGVAAYVHVFRGDQFDGAIAGVVHLESWLTTVLGAVQNADHHAHILLQGHEIYRNDSDYDPVGESQMERTEFTDHGLSWTILTAPTSNIMSAGYADSSLVVLIVGMLLSVVVAIVVYLASVARIQSRQVSEAASQLDTLFQSLPGMAYRCTGQSDRPMEFVSDGCLVLSGYARNDFESQSILWGDLIHSSDREKVSQYVNEAIEVENSYEFEYRILARSGEERWVWESGRVVRRGADDAIRLEGFISDITARKNAVVALVEARAFSEAVVDTAVDAVITIGENSKIETFNSAAQQMLGYTLDEVIGRNVSMLMPEPYRSAHDRYIARYLETGESRIIGTGREIVAQRKDGEKFPIFLSVSEISHWAERKFVGLIRDLSEQRAAENEARQLRDNLAHVDRLNMLGEMATGIAHEINQPLTAISLFAQAGSRLLQSGKNDRMPEIFEKMTKHALRASAVIERMQSMARRQEGIRETVGCAELIEDVANLAEAEAGIRDMTIEVDVATELPEVSVDTVQIQQVALNLLRNGMESMQSVDRRNGSTIRLTAELDSAGDVLMSVIDSGSGVAGEVADLLFAPFSTTKKSGMGMGLSISRAIVIAHGGHLDFFNNEAAGVTFFFTLPPASEEGSNG